MQYNKIVHMCTVMTFSSGCCNPFLILLQKLLIRKGSHCLISIKSNLLGKLSEHTVLANVLAVLEVSLKQLLLQSVLFSMAKSI